MNIPTIAQAQAYLKEAEARNPGPWGDHSRSAANNARAIAEACKGMDADVAYDRLIQLCDAISMPEGAVLVEKRLIDVALRHGAPDDVQKKWMPYFEIKAYFDGRAGQNIYKLLPRIVENTFGW